MFVEHDIDTGGAPVIGPTALQYHALCDKLALAQTAARVGVDHPATIVVGPGGPLGALPEPPCVVKPRLSGEDHGDADAAVSVRTRSERDRAIGELLAAGMEAVVQEHVDGTGWIVRCVRGPGVMELVAFRVERQYPREAGTPSLQTTATAPAALVESTLGLLDAVDYHGPASVCCIERSLLKAATARGWMLDPSPRDPFWLGRLGALPVLEAVRRIRLT